MPPEGTIPVTGSTDAETLLKLGCSLLEADKTAEAVRCLRQAAEMTPDSLPILEKLAEACHRRGQLLPALRAYDRLIELGAATAKTWLATGNALTDVAEYAQAIGAYEHSIALGAGNPEAHHNLARALYRLGDLDRSVRHLETAVSQSDSINSWLSLATMIPGCPAATHDRILDVRRSYGTKLAAHAPGRSAGPISHERPSSPRLRVGYLSAFFHRANYMKPVWGLLNHHDRQSFDIHLFSDTPATKMPGYVRHDRDTIHETGSLSNADLAGLIQDCHIDILVDLNAYSVPERLPLLARKVAPVVMAWFNMYATSGLAGIDAIVGDPAVVRPSEEPFYTEKVLYLPLSYLTFEVLHPVPPVVPPPCLKNGYLTFGSLVSQYKITVPVLDAWAEILRRTDGSRLLLANSVLKSLHNRAYVLERFAERGVSPERLQLLEPAEHYTFLKYYDSIDVALDAFPYNGGTTTMEALWQGVPVLTFDGDRWASRTSPSILRNTHLGEFVANDVQDYVAQAVRLASDPSTPGRLGQIRKQMRKRLRQSRAYDTRLLASRMERLYCEASRQFQTPT
jgi:predicted O-linked N-acetylglucosamine transferase (SPINDLY family)